MTDTKNLLTIALVSIVVSTTTVLLNNYYYYSKLQSKLAQSLL